jgi:glycosyltransferase involved in cell wall biosynthesis
MPRVVHIVTTGGFAGVERYVSDVALETASRGWDVVVVGGDSERVPAAVGTAVRWERGATPLECVRSVFRVGRSDITHAHMTIAEAIAVATRPVHRAPVVSTRHFAARRGTSRAGWVVAPFIAARIAREIAVGKFVAQHIERQPAAVVESGVAESPCLWRPENHVVLVLQRLEAEKDTVTALRAWHASGLVDDGWSLRVVGDGSQRRSLEHVVSSEAIRGVTFAGWTDNVADELKAAGVLLAPAAAEPFGLAVLEAMSAGVPVVACASGGHLETVGLLEDAALFAPRDPSSAATALRSLISDSMRAQMSVAGRRVVAEQFTVERHVDRLLAEYAVVRSVTDLQEPPSVARGLP